MPGCASLRQTKPLEAILGEMPAHYIFMSNLATTIQLLSSIANGILTLEGQNTTRADVFYVWVLAESPSGIHRAQAIKFYNERFTQMMTESTRDIVLLGYFLHPNTSFDWDTWIILIKIPEFRKILHGEQLRADSGGKEEAIQLREELPENLICCARLYDFCANGISEGHAAHVALGEVHNAPAGTTPNKSAMDLIHEEDISPSNIDKEALEELLFNHPDPYDLDETDRVNFSDPGAPVPAVTRS
ncbi:hypothetical protein DFH09DRAFT_1072923 [Mycena vulgaris]|nr:hypothetical protein DFH09DRAFT_1072923 [Mycena vulgaris]